MMSMSAIAFHEKAGLSEVDLFLFFMRKLSLGPSDHPVAILPSAVVSEHFARCKLGVLVSAGAAT
jgi:hypothetical protein